MSGGTTPVDSIGTLTLLNAELLAGLVFSQLVRPGSEIILGSLPARFNMQSMISTYSPESYLINLACAEMMHYYRIPHCGTSGSGTGWSADINAAGDLWMNHLGSVMGKVGIAPFVGGNFDSKAFSPELVVMSEDIIKRSRKLISAFSDVNSASNTEEIIELGPGGDYLTAMSTLNSLGELDGDSKRIWPEVSLEEWSSLGSPGAETFFNDKMKDIDKEIMQELEKNNPVLKEFEKAIKKIRT